MPNENIRRADGTAGPVPTNRSLNPARVRFTISMVHTAWDYYISIKENNTGKEQECLIYKPTQSLSLALVLYTKAISNIIKSGFYNIVESNCLDVNTRHMTFEFKELFIWLPSGDM